MKERNSSNTPTVSYTRGSDLSGTLEGAGGIGGLLGRSHGYASTNGIWYVHNFYHADGNGNITYLVNSSQALAASYKYDPYGNTLSQGGTLWYANVYRFSSKEIHASSGLYYYGYRFYAPNLQRWVNRDPIQERGGINLYRFVNNRPLGEIDPRGETPVSAFCCLSCVALIGWDIYDAITDETCASKSGREFVECVVDKALGSILDNCVVEAIAGGLIKGDSSGKILENVIECFKCDALGAARDAGKLASCGCCIASLLRGRVPRAPPIRPPNPAPLPPVPDPFPLPPVTNPLPLPAGALRL